MVSFKKNFFILICSSFLCLSCFASFDKTLEEMLTWGDENEIILQGIKNGAGFYHAQLNIFSEKEALDYVEELKKKHFNKFNLEELIKKESQENRFAVYPWDRNNKYVSIWDDLANIRLASKLITDDLRNTALIYETSKNLDLYPHLAENFLQDYIIDWKTLENDYLHAVWRAFSHFPENVRKFLKGKAFYLTESYGPSRFFFGSFDQERSDYLGFTAGIFIENQPDKKLLFENIIRMVGFLIYDMCFEPKPIYKGLDSEMRGRPFYYQYPLLQKRKTERDELFTGFSGEKKEKNSNFLSLFSQESPFQDFADHFMYFLLEKITSEDFFSQKTLENETLEKKYIFLEKLVFTNFIEITTPKNRVENADFSNIFEKILENDDPVSLEELSPIFKEKCEELNNSSKYLTTKSLNLSSNLIDKEKIKILGEYLIQNSFMPALEYLDLSFNALNEDCFDKILPLLRRESFLYLNIVGNRNATRLEVIKQFYDNHPDELSKKIIWIPNNWLLKNERRTKLLEGKNYEKWHTAYYESSYSLNDSFRVR